MTLRILTVVGARPQFIKAATISRAIAERNCGNVEGVEEKIVHTGQHYDKNMSDVFFSELEIPSPAYHLGIGSGGHGAQTGHMLAELETVMLRERPDLVLVYGDTNSTLAGALAAVKLHIPVAHVEAGLRSFNRRMPEEINRVMTDHVSSWLFAPTSTAVANLAREGMVAGVYEVGDVMFDGLLYSRRRTSSDFVLAQYGLRAGTYVLATAHRAENTESTNSLRQLVATLEAVVAACGEMVLPLHPRTRQALADHRLELPPAIRTVPPLPYLDLVALLDNARLVVTDSGGVQKEAFFLRVPCLTMREETEWVETALAGANRLVGCSPERAAAACDDFLRGAWVADFDGRPYGDGNAARKILETLVSELAQ